MKETQYIKDTYEVISRETFSDLGGEGLVLRHKKSGARIAVLENNDVNKVFYIAFRTTPTDSTGVPHILEHSVLDGSERFPVKEPFVELCKGSMNTFLNAFTYPDKTVYPVASCNNKDFSNLMSVYLDAVFAPGIYRKKEIFLQEGWHYEMEKKEDPLSVNGVVYSEMKGAFSDRNEVMDTCVYRELFPENCYGFVYGGDPERIPELTYEQFLEFHKRFYHPSNSYIYLYGNMDTAERLEWMDREYLSRYDAIDPKTDIAVQSDRREPMERECFYSVNSEEEAEEASAYCYASFLHTGILEKEKTALCVLNRVLLTMEGAPLKKALTEAGIGADVGGDFTDELLQPVLEIYACDGDAGQMNKFRKVITDTLKKCVKDGLNKTMLTAAVNQMEFRLREADTGSTPKGLTYGLSLLCDWLYDDSRVFEVLRWNEIFSWLREKIETDYFESLITKYILNNPNAVWMTCNPKIGLLEEKEALLAEKLAKQKEAMTAEEIERIVRETKELKEAQMRPDTPEALATIPQLERKDIDPKARPFIYSVEERNRKTMVYHVIPSNRILYVQMLFDTKRLSKEQLFACSVMCELMGKMDTKLHTLSELSAEIGLHTGEIGTDTQEYPEYGKADSSRNFFRIRGKALYAKIPELFSLMTEILFQTDFTDTKRILEILKELKSDMEKQYTDMSQSVAVGRTMSYITESGMYHEWMEGIDFYENVSELIERYEERKEAFISLLEETKRILFARDLVTISITADEEGRKAADSEVDRMDEMLADTSEGTGAKFVPQKKNEGFMTPGRMQYVCCAGNYLKEGFGVQTLFSVLSNALKYGYLWNNIRVTGGAYGGSFYGTSSGKLVFVSWRDPHIARTMQVYRDCADYVEHLEADEREMTKYVIGTMAGTDEPLNPRREGERGLNAFLCGITQEIIQENRNRILSATVEQLRALAPIIRKTMEQDCHCTVGSASKVTEDAACFTTVRNLIR